MKAQQSRAIFLSGAFLLAAGVIASASPGPAASALPMANAPEVPPAQICRNNKDQPRILIVVFHASPDSIGLQAADTVRGEWGKALCKDYFPVVFDDVKNMLSSSGFPWDKALAPWDVEVLAKQMSADMVVGGSASNTGGQWTISPYLVLPVNRRITQPLPSVSRNRLRLAAQAVLPVVTEALKANPEFRKCWLAEGEKRHEDAIKAANAAIAAYPPSTMARVCLAQALENTNASPDSIITVVNFVLKANPKDYFATQFAEHAEREKGNLDRADTLIVQLLALNPTDVGLQEEVITKFALRKNYAGALAVLNEAKQSNPGAPEIVSLEATICMATEDWKCAVSAYEQLAIVDTAAVNIQYFERLAKAHHELKQFQEAANAARRGTSKFPEHANLQILVAQFLRESGDTVGSIAAAKKALAIDPTKSDIYPQILVIYSGRKEYDSLSSLARQAAKYATTANDSLTLANFVLGGAQSIFQAAQADSVKDVNKYVEVIKHAALSDSLTAQPPAKLFLVVSYYQGATIALKAATETKNCELAKLGAGLMAGITQELLRGATPAAQDVVRSIATSTFENPTYGKSVVESVCKPGG